MSAYLPGVPEEVGAEIVASLRRPEGTFEYRATYPQLLDPGAGSGVLLQIVTGAVILLLRRDEHLVLEFLYSSPGSGTYIARADLHGLVGDETCEEFYFALTWSPQGNGLWIGRGDGGGLLQADSSVAPFHMAVGANGNIVLIGSKGVEVMGARIYRDAAQVVAPRAIALWSDTTVAAKTLLGGTSTAGYLYEVVTVNAAIAGLVTGFETYAQGRFVELTREGVHPDEAGLVRAFLSREEKDRYAAGQEVGLLASAKQDGVSVAEAFAGNRRINFQNYDDVKKAFKKGYGITFGDLGFDSQVLEGVKRIISYRHRIIHVSPMIGLLNGPHVPPEEPVFANRATAETAITNFEHLSEDFTGPRSRSGHNTPSRAGMLDPEPAAGNARFGDRSSHPLWALLVSGRA